MEKYIFIGADRVGKSNLILSTAKILTKMNKKVLVVDTTINQSIKSFFDLNFQVETTDPLRDLIPIIRENFDIIFTDIPSNNKFNFDKLNSFDLKKYDYVLIEADEELDENLIDKSKIYLLQDYDKGTLIKNKYILKKFKFSLDMLTIVFINKVESICDNMYFLGELIPCMHKSFKERNEDIEIDYSEQDYINTLSEKLDGCIYLSDFSDEYKSALFKLINTITEITPRKYQKIVK